MFIDCIVGFIVCGCYVGGLFLYVCFFFKQKTAYEMRISDWSSDVCSSDLALALGLIGFVVGKISATFAAPLFPKYVLLITRDAVSGFFAVLAICVLASLVAIRMALKVDPAEAIGG